jgi:MAF protein
MPRLILASTSPYRKAILEKLDVPFEVAAPQVDETPLPQESPAQLVQRLAEAKARAVADAHRDALVIGSDQVAVIEDRILGKPGDHARAVQQLQQASGRTVQFYTGLCVCNGASGECKSAVEPFDVEFRTLSDELIEDYLQKDQPYNCAGSFKSEGLGIVLFERLHGDDPNTLMGLPLIRLIRLLEAFDYDVL